MESQVTIRDLHSRLLLAMDLVSNGYRVIVGRNSSVRKLAFNDKDAVYISDKTSKRSGKTMQKLTNKGYTIFAFCEESTALADEEIYKKTRVDKKAVELSAKIFATNKLHARLINEAVPGFISKIECFGNPRFDLLLSQNRKIFEDKCKKIKKQYGDYILVPSNGIIHSSKLIDEIINKFLDRGEITQDDIPTFKEYFELRTKEHTQFIHDIIKIAHELPAFRFIIRPKNLEETKLLESMYGDKTSNNTVFINKYSVQPWILSCRMLIHNHCTTGMEAFMANKVPVLYQPENISPWNAPAPKHVSHFINNYKKLKDIIMNGQEKMPEVSVSDLQEYLPNKLTPAYKNVSKTMQKFIPDNLSDTLYHQNISFKDKVRLWKNRHHFERYEHKGRGGSLQFSEVKNTVKALRSSFKTDGNRKIRVHWIGKELIEMYLK